MWQKFLWIKPWKGKAKLKGPWDESKASQKEPGNPTVLPRRRQVQNTAANLLIYLMRKLKIDIKGVFPPDYGQITKRRGVQKSLLTKSRGKDWFECFIECDDFSNLLKLFKRKPLKGFVYDILWGFEGEGVYLASNNAFWRAFGRVSWLKIKIIFQFQQN